MTDIPNSMEIEAIEYKKAPEIGKALVTEIDLSRTSRIWMKYASFHSIYAAIIYTLECISNNTVQSKTLIKKSRDWLYEVMYVL